MTREQKITLFLQEHSHDLRWCEPTPPEKRDPAIPSHLYNSCACMGCINGSKSAAWKYQHPEEPRITREEFEVFVKTNGVKVI